MCPLPPDSDITALCSFSHRTSSRSVYRIIKRPESWPSNRPRRPATSLERELFSRSKRTSKESERTFAPHSPVVSLRLARLDLVNVSPPVVTQVLLSSLYYLVLFGVYPLLRCCQFSSLPLSLLAPMLVYRRLMRRVRRDFTLLSLFTLFISQAANPRHRKNHQRSLERRCLGPDRRRISAFSAR